MTERRQHAEIWVEEIQRECLALMPKTLPKTALGQVLTYALNQWLRRCFDFAEVELSNHVAENWMRRPIALDRKRWLHVGSAKAAAILSIVEL